MPQVQAFGLTPYLTNMEDGSIVAPPKWWLDSQTVQGVLLASVPTVITLLHLFGVPIGDSEAQAIVNGLTGVVGIAGAIMAILGRMKASQPLTTKKPE